MDRGRHVSLLVGLGALWVAGCNTGSGNVTLSAGAAVRVPPPLAVLARARCHGAELAVEEIRRGEQGGVIAVTITPPANSALNRFDPAGIQVVQTQPRARARILNPAEFQQHVVRYGGKAMGLEAGAPGEAPPIPQIGVPAESLPTGTPTRVWVPFAAESGTESLVLDFRPAFGSVVQQTGSASQSAVRESASGEMLVPLPAVATGLRRAIKNLHVGFQASSDDLIR